MAHEFRARRRVEFAETDLAGIVHFSNFFRYMEMTEHEFFRSLGLSVHGPCGGQLISWPRVRAECSYKSPLAFEDEFEVHLTVHEKRRRSIHYDFRFTTDDGQLVAHGTIVAVCVAVDSKTGKMTAIAIPPEIDRQIEAAPHPTPLKT